MGGPEAREALAAMGQLTSLEEGELVSGAGSRAVNAVSQLQEQLVCLR